MRVLDAATGEPLAKIAVDKPGDLEAAKDGSVYVLSGGKQLLRLAADGSAKPVIEGLQNAQGLAIGPDGAFYIGVGDPDNLVKVFDVAGKPLRTIGKKGGRPLTGLWEPGGMRFVAGLRLDAKGVLWVAEKDGAPISGDRSPRWALRSLRNSDSRLRMRHHCHHLRRLGRRFFWEPATPKSPYRNQPKLDHVIKFHPWTHYGAEAIRSRHNS